MTEPMFTLPDAKDIELGQRGSTRVYDTGPAVDAPGDLPPLLLLHGWNVDSTVNFGYAIDKLAKTRRVVMYDHHGHGHGPRSTSRFTLEDAAQDAISLLDTLEIDGAVVVGYSMGGAIGQIIAHQFPERCKGLVLMATAGVFCTERRERAMFGAFGTAGRSLRRVPPNGRDAAFGQILKAASGAYPAWILDRVRQADPVVLLEAGAALGNFDSSAWIASLDTPVASVITTRDQVIPTARQVELAVAAGAVNIESVDATHHLPVMGDPRFVSSIERSVAAVDAALVGRNNHQVLSGH